jgi:diaminopropionate ammonia-lyase
MKRPFPFRIARNPFVQRQAAYPEAAEAVLDARSHAEARSCIAAWPGYAPSPLRDLAGLAGVLGIASLHYKDEGGRFALGSFKPLGGAYAVLRLLQKEIAAATGRDGIALSDTLEGKFHDIAAGVTVTGATDGNHGRSVAWGARMFGCRCVIFIHEMVTREREEAIASFGAEVRRTTGTFDDAVRTAQATAGREGWHVIPDTSDGVVVEAPRNVMRGYTVMAGETMEQLPYEGPPTHVFLQAGVGGMAAATCAPFWWTFGADRPATILVEPENAACWFASLAAGEPVAVGGNLESIMAGLACGEVSRLAFEILKPGALAAMTVTDEAAAAAMRLLADGASGDAPIVAGESAVGGLAGLIAAAGNEEARATLGLDARSRIVVFGTEGATDAQTYRQIVGRSAEEVAA